MLTQLLEPNVLTIIPSTVDRNLTQELCLNQFKMQGKETFFNNNINKDVGLIIYLCNQTFLQNNLTDLHTVFLQNYPHFPEKFYSVSTLVYYLNN